VQWWHLKDWEHRDRYPLSIGGEVESKPKPGSLTTPRVFDYAEPHTFENSLIRSLAAAFRKINKKINKTPIY
jgi:hypothetical protein